MLAVMAVIFAALAVLVSKALFLEKLSSASSATALSIALLFVIIGFVLIFLGYLGRKRQLTPAGS